jgi:hypothetical protein
LVIRHGNNAGNGLARRRAGTQSLPWCSDH